MKIFFNFTTNSFVLSIRETVHTVRISDCPLGDPTDTTTVDNLFFRYRPLVSTQLLGPEVRTSGTLVVSRHFSCVGRESELASFELRHTKNYWVGVSLEGTTIDDLSVFPDPQGGSVRPVLSPLQTSIVTVKGQGPGRNRILERDIRRNLSPRPTT